MTSKSGCSAPRVRLRATPLSCSSAILIAALSASATAASPGGLAAFSLHAAAGTSGTDAQPLLVQAQAAEADFRARDVSGPPGRAIPLKIDVLGGTDTESGKLFIFSGLPSGVVLSPGGNFGDFWAVNASVVKDLTLTAPPNFAGSFTVTVTRSRSEADAAKSAAFTVRIGQPDTKPTSAAAPTFPERTAPVDPPSTAARGVPANEQMLLSRADASFKKGDVSGARVIYEYLAMQGSAAGAMAMGETYDPQVLNKMAVKGLTPDTAKARQWYEKAERLGSGDARSRLNALAAK
jgi:hypothetical protein